MFLPPGNNLADKTPLNVEAARIKAIVEFGVRKRGRAEAQVINDAAGHLIPFRLVE
jgi:hypothetical protein